MHGQALYPLEHFLSPDLTVLHKVTGGSEEGGLAQGHAAVRAVGAFQSNSVFQSSVQLSFWTAGSFVPTSMHPFIHLTKMQRARALGSALRRVPGRKDREDAVAFVHRKRNRSSLSLLTGTSFLLQSSATTQNRRQIYHLETPCTGQAWQPRLQEIEGRKGLAVPGKVKVTQERTVSQG